ncbi:very-short-patch-repair endonuclease [Kineosphaera limosa]|uniref:AbiEi antitoxin N-terminal domain-containing protein n=1 Tax=Kineosphaera limosa NBRC 100340 TaxID=1184609 RepID=K6WF35_9MICO|nr:type IV toxin-antitoxin system AbiEi family antitoxin domain-containing protein [Kineosphaera limosa]NYD99796.1 very-short-patch-repair endonuclease [Kineosphaera limosa]GAB97890.1 hypothetical protein KILIM_086_00160 [Kineosphaera limosa NBRC 100340]
MDSFGLFRTLASLDHGLFTTADAASLGIGADRLQREVRRGTVVRLTRGQYAVRDRMTGGSERRHRLRTRAVLASLGAGYVATHHSALLVYNLPTLTPDLATVHVGSREIKRAAAAKGYRRHVLPKATALAQTQPAAVAPAVAIVQTGILEGPRAALVAGDAALRRGRPDLLKGPIEFGNTSPQEIVQALAAYRRVPGKAPVEQILQLVDPRAESAGESLLRYDLVLLRVPVEPQFKLTVGQHTHRADFRVAGTRLLIEFDGLVKLNDPLEGRRADERERALKRQGWIFVRFTWSELGNLELIANRLAAAAAEAGIPWPVAA